MTKCGLQARSIAIYRSLPQRGGVSRND